MDDREAQLKQALMENERLKAQVAAMRMRPAIPKTPQNLRGTSSRSLESSTPKSIAASSEAPPGQATPARSESTTPKTSRQAPTPLSAKTEKTDMEPGDAILDELRNKDHGKLLEQFDLSSPDRLTFMSDVSHSLQYIPIQELSSRAVDARLRRFCQRKVKTGNCSVPDWVHKEWCDLDKREVLRLSLVEALKTCGYSTDAATRKLVKAPSPISTIMYEPFSMPSPEPSTSPLSTKSSLGQVYPAREYPRPREGEDYQGNVVHRGAHEN